MSINIRRERAYRLLSEMSFIRTNEGTIPAIMPKYVAMEMDGEDCTWAMFGRTLDEIKKSIERSDTTGITSTRVYDLDNPVNGAHSFFIPVMKVAKFVEIKKS